MYVHLLPLIHHISISDNVYVCTTAPYFSKDNSHHQDGRRYRVVQLPLRHWPKLHNFFRDFNTRASKNHHHHQQHERNSLSQLRYPPQRSKNLPPKGIYTNAITRDTPDDATIHT